MKFRWQAKNYEGKIVEGILLAENKDSAIKDLRTKNFEIISLNEFKEANRMDSYLEIFDHVSLKDIVNFSKQMSALLEAGVTVVKALQLICDDVQKPILKRTLNSVINDVKNGKSISQAFSKFPKVFNDFYVNLVKSGEESGKMGNAFTYLADYMDRNYALLVKVRNSMIYPAFVIATFIIVMVIVFTFVIPKLAVILLESNVELPMLTRIVLSISDVLVSYGIYVFIISISLGTYLFFKFSGTEAWSRFFDSIKIKVPIVRNVFKMLYVTRIADNIQTLLGSGVSLTKAIQITADVVGNIYYKKILENSLVDVRAGISLSTSLSKYKEMIPNNLTQMLKIGEETGEIGKLMGNIAKFYQREINTQIDTLVGLIEPAMIVLLGLGVGVLLVAVLMPIYNLAGSF